MSMNYNRMHIVERDPALFLPFARYDQETPARG